ncbi:MAG: OmpA family protein [Pseudobdellovibrionaceae bacterium]
MKLFLALTVFVTFLSGCVSSSRHRAEVEQLNDEIKKEKDQVSALTAEKIQLEDKLISSAKDKGLLKASLDDMKKAMDEMRARQAEQKKRLQEFEDLTKRFKKLTDAGALSVKIIDGKMVVSMGSDVLFPSGSARLSKAGLDAVKEVTTQLQAIPGKAFQIEGHTDNVPIATATFPSNWELASARALTVTKSMIEAGMPAERVSAASFGDTHPIQSNETTEGKAANRRIAIVVVPDLSTMPGYDELNKLGATPTTVAPTTATSAPASPPTTTK